jgi:hypothetical protein
MKKVILWRGDDEDAEGTRKSWVRGGQTPIKRMELAHLEQDDCTDLIFGIMAPNE